MPKKKELKPETKNFTITVTNEVKQKLDKLNFNCNKLVNKLLEEYLNKNEK